MPLKMTPKQTAFTEALKALIKTMPRGLCLGLDDDGDGKGTLNVIKNVVPGEGAYLAEIKVRTF